MRRPLSWQVRHSSFFFATGVADFGPNTMSGDMRRSPPSAILVRWSSLLPWQVMQAWSANGVRGSAVTACLDLRIESTGYCSLSSWHLVQTRAGDFAASGVVSARAGALNSASAARAISAGPRPGGDDVRVL